MSHCSGTGEWIDHLVVSVTRYTGPQCDYYHLADNLTIYIIYIYLTIYNASSKATHSRFADLLLYHGLLLVTHQSAESG